MALSRSLDNMIQSLTVSDSSWDCPLWLTDSKFAIILRVHGMLWSARCHQLILLISDLNCPCWCSLWRMLSFGFALISRVLQDLRRLLWLQKFISRQWNCVATFEDWTITPNGRKSWLFYDFDDNNPLKAVLLWYSNASHARFGGVQSVRPQQICQEEL